MSPRGARVADLLARERKTGFPCPKCQKPTRCVDSRPSDDGWRRRRGCSCGWRFSTREISIDEAGVDFLPEIWAAKNLMAKATEAMLALDILLTKAQERAELLREFEVTRYGNAAPRGKHEC